MPLFYFSKVPAMSECIGNSLSTINMDLSSLDNKLYELSAFAVNSVNFLSSSIGSVSSNLQTQINFISSELNSVISDYTQQGIIYQNSNGSITWDVDTHGHNAKVTLTANGDLNNILNCSASDTGNLVIQLSSTAGLSITGWGSNFLFANGVSSMSTGASAYNLLSFYYDGNKFLSSLATF
jgi:hypothetical protein